MDVMSKPARHDVTPMYGADNEVLCLLRVGRSRTPVGGRPRRDNVAPGRSTWLSRRPRMWFNGFIIVYGLLSWFIIIIYPKMC